MSTNETEPPIEPELTDDQIAYERLFGEQPEWCATTTETELSDDDALYAQLFGTTDN